MTVARREMVADGEVGFYHCISRCVRRAFLCGQDPYTGKSFEHRKIWVQSRLKFLASIFGIEVCAFAVMSNHLHVVLRTRPDLVECYEDEEIARRWLILFPKKKVPGRSIEPNQLEIKYFLGSGQLPEIRKRLCSISWFMRCLNENIARQANNEDECKGRFWEGRFKSQALLDDGAVLACMAYVDLNPIRAGLADSPETSLFTSARLRIIARAAQQHCKRDNTSPSHTKRIIDANDESKHHASNLDKWLCPMDNGESAAYQSPLDIKLDEYLNLLDWTGRQLRNDEKRSIPEELGDLVGRLDIEGNNWFDLVEGFEDLFRRAAGKPHSLRLAARRAGRRWLHGLSAGRLYFSAS